MIRLMAEGDDLLLLADGVLAAVENSHFLLARCPISTSVLNRCAGARSFCSNFERCHHGQLY
jgi:tRNA 2-thiouridine synthesizing protein B